VLQTIKNILLPSDPDLHYGGHYGSFSYWRLFLWNLTHPGRLYNRMRYGQLFKINSIRKSVFKKRLLELKENNINPENYTNNQLCSKLDELLNTGGIVIENYFSENKIKKFLDKHKLEIEKIKNFNPTSYAGNNQKNLVISDELVDLWLDPYMIQLISSFYGRDALSRNYPSILYTVSRKKLDSRSIYEKKIKTNVAEFWHVDHSVLFNMHVLLNDINADDAHMQYIPGSHKFPNTSNNFSDEVIKKLGIKPVQCIGKRGTVYMHYGNTLHKLSMEKSKSNRLALHLEFTAGSNILLDCSAISKCLSSGFDLNKLSEKHRNILKGIFPKPFPKGYEINKEAISPTKYKGI